SRRAATPGRRERRAAEPTQAAGGLPVPSAMSAGDRALPAGGAAASRLRRRPSGGLPPPRERRHRRRRACRALAAQPGRRGLVGANDPARTGGVLHVRDVAFLEQHARTRAFGLGVPHSFTVREDPAQVLFLRSAGPDDPTTSLWLLDVASGEERCVVDVD